MSLQRLVKPAKRSGRKTAADLDHEHYELVMMDVASKREQMLGGLLEEWEAPTIDSVVTEVGWLAQKHGKCFDEALHWFWQRRRVLRPVAKPVAA